MTANSASTERTGGRCPAAALPVRPSAVQGAVDLGTVFFPSPEQERPPRRVAFLPAGKPGPAPTMGRHSAPAPAQCPLYPSGVRQRACVTLALLRPPLGGTQKLPPCQSGGGASRKWA